jgi:hypothetical protein
VVFSHGEDREDLRCGNLKIYSGHSRNSGTKGAFTFVGSPYQLTFEESDHANSMPVVNFERDWGVSDTVESGRLAPRHYIIHDDAGMRQLIQGKTLRLGDKVRINMDMNPSFYRRSVRIWIAYPTFYLCVGTHADVDVIQERMRGIL